MNKSQGEETLRNCLEQVAPELNLNDLISYKTGNREHAQDYQNDIIITNLENAGMVAIAKGASYIVKCFYNFGVYVAWNVESGKASGKYIVYREYVMNMENGRWSNYVEKTQEV